MRWVVIQKVFTVSNLCSILNKSKSNKSGGLQQMIRRYLEFVKPYKYRIIATIIVGIIKFGIPMLIPLLIKYAIDGVINNHS